MPIIFLVMTSLSYICYSTEFIFAYLNRSVIRNEAQKNMTGASSHLRVPISFYEALKIPVPPLAEQILSYMDNHFDVATLKDISASFCYYPNYISSLLHKEIGKTFSRIRKKNGKGSSSSEEHNAFYRRNRRDAGLHKPQKFL